MKQTLTLLSLQSQADVDQNEADADAAIAAVQADVDQNEADADAAIAAVQADVDQNEADADAAIAAEEARALAAEGVIQADVDANEADRKTYFKWESNLTKVVNPLRSSEIEVGNNIHIDPAAGYATQFDGNVEFDNNTTLSHGGTALTATFTELNFVDGVTSNIQTQLDAIQADVDTNESDADTAIAAVQADVDQNEADADAAIALKADIASPTFTGTPAAPTAGAGTSTTQLATTAFVATAVANLIDSSPGALNTLNELAAAIGDDANFSTTITNSITAVQNDVDQNELDGDNADAAIVNGTTNFTGFQLTGTAVTATGAELNILDGVTASTAEINLLDGVTATTAELNLLDGVTATTAELNLLDGVTATTAELNYVDGVTSNIQTQLNAIQSDVDTNESDADAAIAAVQADVDQNESDADAAIAAVQADVDQNESDSDAADAAIVDGTTNFTGFQLAGTAVTATGAELNILDGVTATTAELNILDGVTADASELNLLDGVTATTDELNILDGVTSNATELNILDGVTATTAEVNLLDGVTATTAEINYIDVAAAGTAEASKALVLDAGKSISGINQLTCVDLTVQGTTTTVDTVTMQAANAIAFEGATADSNETTLTIIDPDADRTIKLPNQSGCLPVLAADSNVAITATPVELNYVDGVTSNLQTQLDGKLGTSGVTTQLSEYANDGAAATGGVAVGGLCTMMVTVTSVSVSPDK